MPSGIGSLIERRKQKAITPLKMDGIAPFRPKKTTELALLSAPATHVRLSTVHCAPGLVLHHCLDIRTREFFLHPEKAPEAGLQLDAPVAHAPLSAAEQHQIQPAHRAPHPAPAISASAPMATPSVPRVVAVEARGDADLVGAVAQQSSGESTPEGASSSHSRASDVSHASTLNIDRCGDAPGKKEVETSRKRKQAVAHGSEEEHVSDISSPGTPCNVADGVTATPLVRPRQRALAIRLPVAVEVLPVPMAVADSPQATLAEPPAAPGVTDKRRRVRSQMQE